MRTTKIVLGLMALFATTAMAGSNKKPQRTCDECTTKVHACEGVSYILLPISLCSLC